MLAVEKVTVRRGSLYLTRDVYDRHFAGLEAVILLRRGEQLAILPVRHAPSGGYLLKLRNGAGDRVVNAPDFFREHGLSDSAEFDIEVSWRAEDGALLSGNVFNLHS